MNCERVEELLSLYLEGELDSEERALVDGHLASCPGCHSLLALLKKTQESLRLFPEVEVGEKLLGRLYAIPEKKKRHLRLLSDVFLRPSLQPAYAVATFLLIIFSFYTYHPQGKTIARSIDRQLHLGYSRMEKLYVEAGSLAGSLSAYKDDILVSLKSTGLLGEKKD